ncbi:MAG: DUF485 domain-containing protein [Spirochaetaceae bacterium]|nr:DUF485 domain-containing protein [Spirochaetaceae bacterium]
MPSAHEISSEDHAKARLGLIMFGLYALVYAGFVLINTVAPKLMGAILFAGLTLAVVYGVFLILLAIVLGLIYNQVATRMETQATNSNEGAAE